MLNWSNYSACDRFINIHFNIMYEYGRSVEPMNALARKFIILRIKTIIQQIVISFNFTCFCIIITQSILCS